VHNFKAKGAAPSLTVTTKANAALQLRLLLRRKIEKPQGQEARSVRDPHEHLSASPDDDLGELYFTLHHGPITGP